MLKKANIQWTGKTLCNQIEKGNVLFNCTIQRNPVWDLARKSLLIHSMIEGYPIPAFYFARRVDKKYDALDGLQRSDAISKYLKEEYILTNDTPNVIDEDGYSIDIAGKSFSELPEWAQDNIKDYSLTIYYFEDITDEEIKELFFRINNGKPLTNIELTRVKAKSLTQFQKIASHEVIRESVTDAGKRGYKDENLAMQAWTLCYTDFRDFSTKGFRPYIETAVVTGDQIAEMNDVMNTIKTIRDSLDTNNKKDKRVMRKLKTRSHLISSIYLASQAKNKGVGVDELSKIIYEFFDSTKASVNEKYNESVGQGSAKADRVRMRIQILDSLLEGNI